MTTYDDLFRKESEHSTMRRCIVCNEYEPATIHQAQKHIRECPVFRVRDAVELVYGLIPNSDTSRYLPDGDWNAFYPLIVAVISKQEATAKANAKEARDHHPYAHIVKALESMLPAVSRVIHQVDEMRASKSVINTDVESVDLSQDRKLAALVDAVGRVASALFDVDAVKGSPDPHDERKALIRIDDEIARVAAQAMRWLHARLGGAR